MVDTEIDEVTINVLAEILFRPAGFGYTVLMMHTGLGERVDVMKYAEPESNDSGTARLLFYP